VHDGYIAEPSDALLSFRRSLYESLRSRSGPLFELADAILTADGAVPSPVHLSLRASHRRGWGSLLEEAGLPDIRFHDLRHTCVTLLFSRGVHPKHFQELLGHATVAIARHLQPRHTWHRRPDGQSDGGRSLLAQPL
jgi:integrase